MNTKLQAVCDSQGRLIDPFLSDEPVSDYIGAHALVSGLPNSAWYLGDRSYDAEWSRKTVQDKKIRPCIQGRKKRKTPVQYDKRRYKCRDRIKIMFGRLKNWQRGTTDAQKLSSRRSHSPQPSSSGCEWE